MRKNTFSTLAASAAFFMAVSATSPVAAGGNSNNNGPTFNSGGGASSNVDLDLTNRNNVVNNLLASGGYSRAEAEAIADAYAQQSQGQKQSQGQSQGQSVDVNSANLNANHNANNSSAELDNRNTNVNASVSTGGNARQSQSLNNKNTNRTNVGGQANSQTVVVEGDDNNYPVSSAIAPSLVIGHGGCDFSHAITGAYQSDNAGVSGGAGLFWSRKETCYDMMLVDRYIAIGDVENARRIMREVEESFE